MKHCKSFRERAARLALTGAALAGIALCTPAAQAAVVTTDFSSNPLSTVPFNLGGVYINVATGAASTDFNDPAVAGWDINPFFMYADDPSRPATFDLYTPAGGGLVVAGIIPSSPAEELAIGQTIGPGSVLKFGFANAGSDSTDVHYIGFVFKDEATSLEDYGYLAIQQSVSPAAAGSVRILGWAYDDTGGPITVSALSAVPEPANGVLLVAGLLAFGALRAGRRAKGGPVAAGAAAC